MINDHLDRAFAGKNIVSFDVNRLARLYLYSNGKAYTNTLFLFHLKFLLPAEENSMTFAPVKQA